MRCRRPLCAAWVQVALSSLYVYFLYWLQRELRANEIKNKLWTELKIKTSSKQQRFEPRDLNKSLALFFFFSSRETSQTVELLLLLLHLL